MKNTSLFTIALFTAMTTMAQIPETINFQGNLTEPGTSTPIADGDYTIDFAFFDVATAGSAGWGETQTVTVINGIFNVKLGAVNPLDPSLFSQPLWLELTVGGETLSPRIELSSTAYSMNSANTESFMTPYTKISDVGFSYIAGDTSTQNYPFAPGAIDLGIDDNDTGFDVLTDGNLSFYTNAVERMLLDLNGILTIGDPPIAVGSGTLLELNTDAVGTGWGGMWITNTAATGIPYYGYQINGGAAQAYTYLDGTDGNKWKLWNTGDRLTVTPTGNVGIGTNNPIERLSVNGNVAASGSMRSNGFEYQNSVTRYLSVPASAFNISQRLYIESVTDNDTDGQPNSNSDFRTTFRNQANYYASVGGGDITFGASMYAPVYLPDGAIITAVEALVFENHATYDVGITLYNYPFSVQNVANPLASASTTGSPGHTTISETGLKIVVDNANFSDGLQFNTQENTSGSMVIYHVRITYEVSTLD